MKVSMPEEIYKGYTIKVSSAIQHVDGGWEALAMVWSKDMSVGHPIVTGELEVTEAREGRRLRTGESVGGYQREP